MFGVGTDYCLLLVSRYREELRRIEDKHEAMARALARAGPAILASGLHGRARDARAAGRRHAARPTRSGPVAAIGVASRAARRPHAAARAADDRRAPRASGRAAPVAYAPGAELAAHGGIWRRFGDRVLQRPGRRARGHGRALRRRRARPARLQGGLLDRRLLQEETESVDGFKRHRAGVPGGRARPDDGARRARRRAGRPRPTSPRPRRRLERRRRASRR